jgi:hypothetical protein
MSTTFRPDVALLEVRRLLLTPAQEAHVAQVLGVAAGDYAPDVPAARILPIVESMPEASDDARAQAKAAADAGTTWTFFPSHGLPASLAPETTPPGVEEANLSLFRANALLRALGVPEDDLPCGSMAAEEMLERLSLGTFPGIEDAAERLRRVALDAHARDVAVVWG